MNTITTQATTNTRAKALASTFHFEGNGKRRTPYHEREAYLAGDTAKKAGIIRSVLRMKHKVITVVGEKEYPVSDARSLGGFVQLCANGAWNSTAPIFINPSAK